MKIALFLSALLVLAGCEGVPDVTFADSDATATADAGIDGSADGSVDAQDDHDATSGCVDGGGGTPPNGAICCTNGIACGGGCTAQSCIDCAGSCNAGDLCCVKPNGKVRQCNAPSMPCP